VAKLHPFSLPDKAKKSGSIQLTKMEGHSIRGQTRICILLEWSNNKATASSTVFFRYYKGAGWVGPVSSDRKALGEKYYRDISALIVRRINSYRAKGYVITGRKFGHG
jgi:hypothetical protein